MGNTNITSIQIEGMTCASCVGRVEKALKAGDGRAAAVIAVSDPIKASTPTVIAALHNLGLKVA